MDILGTLQKLSMESGFAAFFVTDGGWKNLIMIIIAFVLLYLGIVKKFEPLLRHSLRLPADKPELLHRHGRERAVSPRAVGGIPR